MKKIFLVITVISLTFFSCEKKDGGDKNNGDNTKEVTISSFSYSPVTLTISTGTVVKWVNNDGVAHTVTSNNDLFDSGRMENGQTFEHTFNDAGTYEYFCAYHSGMQGTIIVE